MAGAPRGQQGGSGVEAEQRFLTEGHKELTLGVAGWQKPGHSSAHTRRHRHCISAENRRKRGNQTTDQKNSEKQKPVLPAVGCRIHLWQRGGVVGGVEQSPFSDRLWLLLQPLMQVVIYSRSPVERFPYSSETSPGVRTPACTCPHIRSDTLLWLLTKS